MPNFELNRDTDCAQPVTGLEGRVWFANHADWVAYKAAENPTVVNRLMSTFPEAAAPFLRQLPAPKNMEDPFEMGVASEIVEGKMAIVDTVKLRLAVHRSADVHQTEILLKCGRIVIFGEKVGISGDGKYFMLGEEVGLDVSEFTMNFGKMGGQTDILLKSGVSRYENHLTTILHVTDDATTLAAITANTVPVV